MAFKIIVCAKQVPDTNVIKINPKTGTLIRDGVPSILNHDDANALEEALKIKDKYDDVTITVVSMGPPQASDLLFECIAKGADEGILVSDRAVGGSDTWATSNTLEAAIKKWEKENGPADLIFAGRQAIDGDTAQVGPQIAEHLDIPVISYAQDIKIEGDKVIVQRQYDDRYHVLEAKMPCLITALSELNEPRYMTPGGIFDACAADITTWGRADLKDVDDSDLGLKGSPTKIAKASDKVRKGAGEKVVPDSPEDAVAYIVGKFKEKHII